MLTGMPIKEYTLIKDEEEIQIAEKLLNEYLALGWKLCPNCEPKMSYAIPSWVPTDPEEEVILLLDDYTRATSLFLQATMSLIQFQEYISWKLPEKTHLILTSNEDNGSSNISSLDSAQLSRFINFSIDFDHKQYGSWMDKNNMMSEAINFMLLNPEIFRASETINARTYTMFTNAISGFKNLDNEETLGIISTIAKGCFGKDTTVGDMFAAFVHNKLDKLLTAEQMITKDWDDVRKELLSVVNKDNVYRADIASVLTMRLVNYINNLQDNKKVDKAVKFLEEIFTCPDTLLTEDLLFSLIREMNKKYGTKCQKLMLNPKIRTKLLGGLS